MRRGYSRESYLELVDHVRSIIPEVRLSGDMIAGFCGETDEDFEETLSLIETVKYDLRIPIFSPGQEIRELTHLFLVICINLAWCLTFTTFQTNSRHFRLNEWSIKDVHL